nr:tyrosine-protein phosphatase [Rhodococcus sp. MTM3W5.2]
MDHHAAALDRRRPRRHHHERLPAEQHLPPGDQREDPRPDHGRPRPAGRHQPDPTLGVDATYLEAGLAQITADYGSVSNYLTQGLGLSQDTITALKAKLVA